MNTLIRKVLVFCIGYTQQSIKDILNNTLIRKVLVFCIGYTQQSFKKFK